MSVWRAMVAAVTVAGLTGCLSFHPTTPPGAPGDATFAQVQDTTMRFVDEGSGPAVVLIHGFASSLNAWDSVRPALRRNHRVLAVDLKGFGWTSRPDGDYSPQAQAKLVLEFLKQRGVERFALVGHSWGSSVVLQMALIAPESVERIALYDAWVYAEQLPTFFFWSRASGIGEVLFALFYNERTDEKMVSAFYDPSIISEEFVESVEEQVNRPGTRAAALAAVRGQRFEAWQADYGKIKQPTLLLWGREDAVTRLKFGEMLLRQLPNADMKVYPRCGHFPMIEAANASTDDLVEFLDKPYSQPDIVAPATPGSEPAAVSAAVPVEAR